MTTWVLVVCFMGSTGLCSSIERFPQASKEDCGTAQAITVRSPQVKWAMCRPKYQPEAKAAEEVKK
jgi:hypothetical protein